MLQMDTSEDDNLQLSSEIGPEKGKCFAVNGEIFAGGELFSPVSAGMRKGKIVAPVPQMNSSPSALLAQKIPDISLIASLSDENMSPHSYKSIPEAESWDMTLLDHADNKRSSSRKRLAKAKRSSNSAKKEKKGVFWEWILNTGSCTPLKCSKDYLPAKTLHACPHCSNTLSHKAKGPPFCHECQFYFVSETEQAVLPSTSNCSNNKPIENKPNTQNRSLWKWIFNSGTCNPDFNSGTTCNPDFNSETCVSKNLSSGSLPSCPHCTKILINQENAQTKDFFPPFCKDCQTYFVTESEASNRGLDSLVTALCADHPYDTYQGRPSKGKITVLRENTKLSFPPLCGGAAQCVSSTSPTLYTCAGITTISPSINVVGKKPSRYKERQNFSSNMSVTRMTMAKKDDDTHLDKSIHVGVDDSDIIYSFSGYEDSVNTEKDSVNTENEIMSIYNDLHQIQEVAESAILNKAKHSHILTAKECERCSMSMMQINGRVYCVTCPKIQSRARCQANSKRLESRERLTKLDFIPNVADSPDSEKRVRRRLQSADKCPQSVEYNHMNQCRDDLSQRQKEIDSKAVGMVKTLDNPISYEKHNNLKPQTIVLNESGSTKAANFILSEDSFESAKTMDISLGNNKDMEIGHGALDDDVSKASNKRERRAPQLGGEDEESKGIGKTAPKNNMPVAVHQRKTSDSGENENERDVCVDRFTTDSHVMAQNRMEMGGNERDACIDRYTFGSDSTTENGLKINDNEIDTYMDIYASGYRSEVPNGPEKDDNDRDMCIDRYTLGSQSRARNSLETEEHVCIGRYNSGSTRILQNDSLKIANEWNTTASVRGSDEVRQNPFELQGMNEPNSENTLTNNTMESKSDKEGESGYDCVNYETAVKHYTFWNRKALQSDEGKKIESSRSTAADSIMASLENDSQKRANERYEQQMKAYLDISSSFEKNIILSYSSKDDDSLSIEHSNSNEVLNESTNIDDFEGNQENNNDKALRKQSTKGSDNLHGNKRALQNEVDLSKGKHSFKGANLSSKKSIENDELDGSGNVISSQQEKAPLLSKTSGMSNAGLRIHQDSRIGETLITTARQSSPSRVLSPSEIHGDSFDDMKLDSQPLLSMSSSIPSIDHSGQDHQTINTTVPAPACLSSDRNESIFESSKVTINPHQSKHDVMVATSKTKGNKMKDDRSQPLKDMTNGSTQTVIGPSPEQLHHRKFMRNLQMVKKCSWSSINRSQLGTINENDGDKLPIATKVDGNHLSTVARDAYIIALLKQLDSVAARIFALDSYTEGTSGQNSIQVPSYHHRTVPLSRIGEQRILNQRRQPIYQVEEKPNVSCLLDRLQNVAGAIEMMEYSNHSSH